MDTRTAKPVTHIDKFSAQKKLSVLWFICSFAVILLFVVFTVTPRFENIVNDAWQWLLNQIIPVLTLFIGIFVKASSGKTKPVKVNIFYYRLTWYLSLGYFLLLFLTIFAIPLAFIYTNRGTLDFLKLSSAYLIPFLGLVTASLGMFFSAREQ